MADFALRALKHLQLPLKSPLEAVLPSTRGSITGCGLGKGQCMLTPGSEKGPVTRQFASKFDFTWCEGGWERDDGREES